MVGGLEADGMICKHGVEVGDSYPGLLCGKCDSIYLAWEQQNTRGLLENLGKPCRETEDSKQSHSVHDPINPAHYNQGKVECIDAIEAATKGLDGVEAFCTGNTIKYLWRWKNKGGVEDLKKARWYLDRMIDRINGERTIPPPPAVPPEFTTKGP